MTYSFYIKNCTESRDNAIRVASVVVVGSPGRVDIAEVGSVADIRRTQPPIAGRANTTCNLW